MASDFEKELTTIQTWIKSAAKLNSYRLSDAPPKVARPVVLWETPNRSKDRNTSAYQYVTKVRQFGKLFARNLDEVNEVQAALMQDIEERGNVLNVKDQVAVGGKLKAVEISFENSDSLDIPFSVTYEVTYTKNKPAQAPNATSVYTRTRVLF